MNPSEAKDEFSAVGGDFMGGQVLDLPEIRAYDEGVAKGIEQGIDQGVGNLKAAVVAIRNGDDPSEIQKRYGIKTYSAAEELIKSLTS